MRALRHGIIRTRTASRSVFVERPIGGKVRNSDMIPIDIERHISLLKQFAAIPAPSHNEDKRVEFLLRELHGMGIDDAYSDEAKNVLVPMGCEGAGGITVYTAHTDVVFPDTTPLPVREEGGRLYAPGVGDDTANAAAMLTTIRFIKENGLRAKEPVLFVFDSCEEGLGNLKGVRRIMSDFEGRIKELVSFDCSLDEGIVVKAVGSERFRVTARTKGGHSYGAFGSPNAIHRMAELITKLYRQELPASSDQRTTYNVGVIQGGTSVNTIAPSAEMLYEFRSDEHSSLEFMRKQFLRLLREADCPEAHFEAEVIGERPCGKNVDPEAQARLLGRCSAAIKAVTGEAPLLSSGSTDANVPLSLGVPAVTFGLYIGAGAHTRDEWLELNSLETGLEIALKLVVGGHFE